MWRKWILENDNDDEDGDANGWSIFCSKWCSRNAKPQHEIRHFIMSSWSSSSFTVNERASVSSTIYLLLPGMKIAIFSLFHSHSAFNLIYRHFIKIPSRCKTGYILHMKCWIRACGRIGRCGGGGCKKPVFRYRNPFFTIFHSLSHFFYRY